MTVKIEFTKGQCESLSEFIEMNLLDVIRKDVDIDNLNWVRNILDAQKIFEEVAKK